MCQKCVLSSRKPCGEETKRKIALERRKIEVKKFLELGFACPRANPTACKFIDTWGISNGYSFQHGMNGGEKYIAHVGAFVDGYDEKKNVVFEYDEPHHFDKDGNLKKKDVNRMFDLMRELKCHVIRYNEKSQEITEYEPQIAT